MGIQSFQFSVVLAYQSTFLLFSRARGIANSKMLVSTTVGHMLIDVYSVLRTKEPANGCQRRVDVLADRVGS
ncbi:hypothetical protein BX661DRAFT_10796 [Kickxella alabastrina]|uniref:uncharacterized protein n=1 Tax=Kickxella alabastrina TaxID=61397 RepID=UPI00221E56C6|nr:uncharacterized protein BX661DRAFT_10796 [Kickxella alabastrina]KAI7835104.1 hypothetical protein BX661DRAFT_10796 [Kickxella alabastrina]